MREFVSLQKHQNVLKLKTRYFKWFNCLKNVEFKKSQVSQEIFFSIDTYSYALPSLNNAGSGAEINFACYIHHCKWAHKRAMNLGEVITAAGRFVTMIHESAALSAQLKQVHTGAQMCSWLLQEK
jgi:hypothetical protein